MSKTKKNISYLIKFSLQTLTKLLTHKMCLKQDFLCKPEVEANMLSVFFPLWGQIRIGMISGCYWACICSCLLIVSFSNAIFIIFFKGRRYTIRNPFSLLDKKTNQSRRKCLIIYLTWRISVATLGARKMSVSKIAINMFPKINKKYSIIFYNIMI